jgi:SAM-dependent methyltransferase
LHSYWSTRGFPDTDGTNAPEAYLSRVPWSVLLADWIGAPDLGLGSDARILELGCNIGRNLAFLRYRGYRNLCGIEINPAVAAAMRAAYPETAQAVDLTIGALEDVLPRLPDRSFDLVFAVATLMHIHPDVEGCLAHVPRITRGYICTIEQEDKDDCAPSHFQRDYREVFSPMGCRQIKSLPFGEAGTELTTLLNLEPGYVARLFERG